MAITTTAVNDAVGLAASLMREVSQHGLDKIYVIDRGFWSRLFDWATRNYGIFRFTGEGFEIVISRHSFPWGYLRARVFDCYIEGILRFRQKKVYFKPLRIEGECKLYSAQADALGAVKGGVEPVDPEEVEW
ncbi:hypothetical protein Pyrfu_1062 [Pyrolobus fumarii 1A]|uniref:Uncharacterized protein n=1 Tax=Pyrolobus fumarii (strain DSM 11204 / 1A) TaxID=694429 RepID=G0EF33_PYRF1|nr:hypothetical protein [Pyrolobus fumarii]AEM38930.1 hypothetical protein Pyrfu_1062 [Pyrolobus fumarii 1A]